MRVGDAGQKVCASPLVPLVIGQLLKVQVGWLQANLAKAAVRRDCCVLFLSSFFLSSFFSASLLMVSTRISTTPRQADLSWASSRQSCSMPHFTNPAAPVHSSDTSDHLLTGLLVRTNTHTHLYLYLHLYLQQPELTTWSPFRGCASRRQQDFWSR